MRTTITVDDAIWEEALRVTSAKKKSSLVEEALRALIDQAARRRAIALAGTMPDIEAPPRRRTRAHRP